jgi:glycosyltransferase involved in cell wall biosynthesis
MIAVIVPAHNEIKNIAKCIESVARSAAHDDLNAESILIIVAADACTDGTETAAKLRGATVVTVCAQNVGVARREGAQIALEHGARCLAFTDADTVVSADWLVQQLARGADAVCGVVEVTDWSEHSAAVRRAFAMDYCDVDGHRHIHGANFGVSANAYQRAGGFQPLKTGEDVALVEALVENGENVVWSAAPRVATSARLSFKAPSGFGATLLALGTQYGASGMPGEFESAEMV